MFFKVDKIEERENLVTNDPEFTIILRFSLSEMRWGWATNLANVVRRAVNGLVDRPIDPTMN